MSLVSVIIPVYNHVHTLKKSLDSLALQAHEQDLQVIVVNDGSTDNFVLPDSKGLNIQLINQENLGAPAARNRGLKEAKGEYILFVDADTIFYPRMIAEMREALEKNPSSSYAYSQFRFGWKKIKSHAFDAGLLKKVNYIDTTSLIRAKDVIPFDETLKRFQDWDLWLTMAEQGKTGIFAPKILFRKMVGDRKGISSWLPSWFYRLPWKTKKVREYEQAREIVLKKHGSYQ